MTDIGSLGEFGLIDRLTAGLQPLHPETYKSIGDDAAVIRQGDDFLLISKDLLVEGVHFDLSYYPLQHLGYKAAVVNISDIAAMGGTPLQLLVGIAISSRFSLEAIEEIYAGIRKACQVYGLDLIGGDTTASKSGLLLSVTVTGKAKENEIRYRSGAQKGDLLCVSGDLGAAYAGLLILEREKSVFKSDPQMQPALDGYEYILERQLKPEARTQLPQLLNEAGITPTAMIDISDGLASEAIHICRASGLGCSIYAARIPIDPATMLAAAEFNIEPLTAALHGGEDYELLFTIPLQDFDKISKFEGIHIIGHMTDADEGMFLIGSEGETAPLMAQGWDALLRRDPETRPSS